MYAEQNLLGGIYIPCAIVWEFRIADTSERRGIIKMEKKFKEDILRSQKRQKEIWLIEFEKNGRKINIWEEDLK